MGASLALTRTTLFSQKRQLNVQFAGGHVIDIGYSRRIKRGVKKSGRNATEEWIMSRCANVLPVKISN
jgi:hypothetical protein